MQGFFVQNFPQPQGPHKELKLSRKCTAVLLIQNRHYLQFTVFLHTMFSILEVCWNPKAEIKPNQYQKCS